MYLQRVQNSTLSPFDEKRCYINNIENTLWNQKLGFSIVCFVRIQLCDFNPSTFHFNLRK